MRAYLGSTKNLVGCVAGLVGVVLNLVGVVGDYWLLVVAGLYLAGALLAPPDRIRLVPIDPTAEAGQLRTDLDMLLRTVTERRNRMPDTAVDRVRRIGEVLSSMLERPAELTADPEVLHAVTRLARVDLPLSVQSYLNLPWWLSAAKELLTQLELLETDAHRIAERFYSSDIRQQEAHTRYLRERTQDEDGPVP